jgi:hypothetical protein
MFTIKYWPTNWQQKHYIKRAIELSAQINEHGFDTCEIEEGEKQQFDIFHNGELVLSQVTLGELSGQKFRLPVKEDVDEMLDRLDPHSG